VETELIKFVNNGNDKLRASIQAFIRMPNSRKIYDIAMEHYLKRYDGEKVVNIKLGLISQMNNLIERFEANCSIDDLPHLESTKKFIADKSDVLIREIETLDVQKSKERIDLLGGFIEHLRQMDTINDDDFQTIKRLDDDIDKELLMRNKGVSNLYYDQIKRMQMIVKENEKRSADANAIKLKRYNKTALGSFKQAIENYHNDKGTYNRGDNLDQMVALLGGFNTNYFSPEVSMFFGFVYGEIFGGLKKPDSKIWITEAMLNANEKEL
jgi:hypothetical protein